MASPPNQIVVYSPRPAVTGNDLLRTAKGTGSEVRLFAFGVFPILEDDPLMTNPIDTSFLMAVWPSENKNLTDQLNQLIEPIGRGMPSDEVRQSLGNLMKQGTVPWFECHVGAFNAALAFLRLSEKLKAELSPNDFPKFLESKIRYIFDNKSRRKTTQSLMARISETVAAATSGISMKLIR